jgi:enoyl-[acyl-carrier protein] reductase I
MGTAKAALEHIIRQLAYELGERNIRVNGISAGPLPTLSARGVPGFTDFLKVYPQRAPLKRNITHEEVAKAALFLLSDMASGITGEILYVDAGYHITAF